MRRRHFSILSTWMVFGFTLVGILPSGCGWVTSSAQKELQDQQVKLMRKWVLHEMPQEQEGVAVPLSVAMLEFSENQYHGTGGCNSCGGDYVLSAPGRIQLGGGAWTEMACEDDQLMTFEMRFATVLGQVTHYQVSDTELQLSDGTDHNRLIFKPYLAPPPLNLQATDWSLELFEESDEIAFSATSVISGTQITLTLNDGVVEGFGGASPYQGTFRRSGHSIKLTVSPLNGGSGPPEVTEQQARYLKILNHATHLHIDHQHLRISNATGTQSLVFSPCSAAKNGTTPP